MVHCFVPECNHHCEAVGCKSTRFPKDPILRQKWINLIRRADVEPSRHSRVCECHFRDGNFTTLPSLFEWNKKKHFDFVSPEKKKRCPRRRTELAASSSNAPSVSSTLFSIDDDALLDPDSQTTQNDVVELERTLVSMNVDEDHRNDAQVTCTDEVRAGPESVSVQTILSVDPKKYVYSSETYEAIIGAKDREIERLQQEICKLKNQVIGYDRITNDTLCLQYTGITKAIFDLLLSLCRELPREYYQGVRVVKLPDEDQLLLTLMKLRLNSLYFDLGLRFGVCRSTAFNVVYAFLPVLHIIVYHSVLKKMPSQRRVKHSLPDVFTNYPNCRVVIDCTEMECQVPKNMRMQKITYSSYKKRNTIKLLLGIAPNGCIILCSDAYPGSISDKEITKHCGILSQLETGDLLLADKGFLISDIMPPGVQVNVPPFLMAPQFTQEEVEESKSISRARCHVERANSRLKKYRVLRNIPRSFFPRTSVLVQVCAGLVNFQNPLFKSMAKDFLLNTENFEQEITDDLWYDD